MREATGAGEGEEGMATKSTEGLNRQREEEERVEWSGMEPFQEAR